MKHLKPYKLFESVELELKDIIQEINDESLWKADAWSEPNGYVVVIQTIDEDYEYELEVQTPPSIVVESIERLIDYISSQGFPDYRITLETAFAFEPDQIEEITLDEVSNLDVWPNNFIRVEFWNEQRNN